MCSIVADRLPVHTDWLQIQEALVAVVFIVHAGADNGVVAMVGIVPVGLIAIVRSSIYQ